MITGGNIKSTGDLLSGGGVLLGTTLRTDEGTLKYDSGDLYIKRASDWTNISSLKYTKCSDKFFILRSGRDI